jgi:DNA-binding NtrC family response regulator
MEKKLILIVDDEDQICSELEGYLSQKGYKTITANNGSDAYDLFMSEKPVCVLTDYRMPIMDGIELLKMIKAANRHVQVILISGVADMKAIVEAMKNEAFDFLSKLLRKLWIH